MENDTAAQYAYSVDRERRRGGLSRADQSAGDDAGRLAWRASLIVVLLLSLGLWAMVWAAVAALASAALG